MIGGWRTGKDWEFFSSPPRPDRLWGPPNFLSDGYQGRQADHSPPSNAEVKYAQLKHKDKSTFTYTNRERAPVLFRPHV